MASKHMTSIIISNRLWQLRDKVGKIWRTKPVSWLRRRAYRFVQRSRLLAAVFATVLLAVGIGIWAYQILRGLLPQGAEPVQPKELTQFALAIAAGIGGVVALVVAYRRQQGLEQSRFVERFGAAATQLGHSDVAVRLAGVYAMAGVADEASKLERQQCVDVLCGYLRLPYSPDLMDHQSELQYKVPGREGEESTQKYLYRQNDKEVRQTIVRVIATHLRPGAATSWSRCIFEFQGAVLEDAEFTQAVFRAERTSFEGAKFSGDLTSFASVIFRGRTRFDRATFSGNQTNFCHAEFRDGWTTFRGAKFHGTVDFTDPWKWDPAPLFDWDTDLPKGERRQKPDSVLPDDWPPVVSRGRSPRVRASD